MRTSSITVRTADCQRKFSCTIRVFPVASTALTMARASAIFSAKGFWQITCIFFDAAISTSTLWDETVVAISTVSKPPSWNISAALVYWRLILNSSPVALRFTGSVSHSATTFTPSIAHQARSWFWAKKPQPISATFKCHSPKIDLSPCHISTQLIYYFKGKRINGRQQLTTE